MNILWLVLIVGILLSVAAAFAWLATTLSKLKPKDKAKTLDDLTNVADADVEHIFNNEFREELRNRGRLHFEKIISENAMFLQQDLRLTTAQLNDFMKDEIKKTLKDEFAKYEQSFATAKDIALESIQKTQSAVDQQRVAMEEQVRNEIAEEHTRALKKFSDNMAEIVNHYIIAAVGTEIDLNDQLEFILGYLEDNKQAIIDDVQNGA